MNTTENSEQVQPLAVPLQRPVRPLPAPHYPQWSHSNEHAAWTERQVRAIVADEVAAERERWRQSLADALDFLERHSNRWDGANGKHPHEVAEAARALLMA